MAPLKPCEGPCFIPWGKEGWGCAADPGRRVAGKNISL